MHAAKPAKDQKTISALLATVLQFSKMENVFATRQLRWATTAHVPALMSTLKRKNSQLCASRKDAIAAA